MANDTTWSGPPCNVAEVADDLIRKGYALCAIPPGAKVPQGQSWGHHPLRSGAELPEGYGLGVIHGLTGTLSIDEDHLELSERLFQHLGIPEPTHDVPIWTGQSGRRKRLYRLPEGWEMSGVKKLQVRLAEGEDLTVVFEIRGSTAGAQVQDVIPPTVHPGTGQPYQWLNGMSAFPAVEELPWAPQQVLDLVDHWNELRPQLMALAGDIRHQGMEAGTVEPGGGLPFGQVPMTVGPAAGAESAPVATGVPGARMAGFEDLKPHVRWFNTTYSLKLTLAQYGYRQCSAGGPTEDSRWLRPGSSTGVAGTVIYRDNLDRFYAHDGSEYADGRPHDVFDLYTLEVYGGNQGAAHRAVEHLWREAHPEQVEEAVLAQAKKQSEADTELNRLLGRVHGLSGQEVHAAEDQAQVREIALQAALSGLDDMQWMLIVTAIKARMGGGYHNALQKIWKAAQQQAKLAGGDGGTGAPDDGRTHEQLARDYAHHLATEVSVAGEFLAVRGALYVCGQDQLWKASPLSEHHSPIGQRFQDEPRCKTKAGYRAVAQHVYDIHARELDPFAVENRPLGLAAGGTYYRVTGNTFQTERLDWTHYAFFQLPFLPAAGEMPMFMDFLRSAFEGADCAAQIELLREALGATLTGLLPAAHKAVLLYGAERSGKGTLLRLLKKLFPTTVVSAVNPQDWDGEYHLAKVAGLALNVFGEVESEKAFPAARFNGVVGGDLVTGRHPMGQPFHFQNTAAHWMASEHLPWVRSRERGFFERWLAFKFLHRRQEHLRVHNLEDQILEAEGSAIVWWALEGAARFLASGRRWSLTRTHHSVLAEMRHGSDTREAFLTDPEMVVYGPDLQIERKDLHLLYQGWCRMEERRPVGRGKLYQAVLAHPGVQLVTLEGERYFKGVGIAIGAESVLLPFR